MLRQGGRCGGSCRWLLVVAATLETLFGCGRASLPHGDTSGEEAGSCEGLIKAMAKGARENVDEHDSDQEAESKVEDLDGRDLKEGKRCILRNYSKTGKRA
jgi:hypothetical protein